MDDRNGDKSQTHRRNMFTKLSSSIFRYSKNFLSQILQIFFLFLYIFSLFLFLVCGLLDSDEFRGDTAKTGYRFANYGLKELYFTNGIQKFPQEPFTPTYDGTNKNFWREFLSLFSANGVPGASVKSDFGLARLLPESYADNFCLYKISTSKIGVEPREVLGPSYFELKENCSNLDAFLTFNADTTTSLDFLVLQVFHDSFEIGMTQNSDRDVILSFNH